MTRPIVWAVASFAGIALAATFAAERLSRLAPPSGHAASRPATALSKPRALGPEAAGQELTNAGRILVVEGDRRGHFQVDAAIDGRRVPMLVDTGASIVVLTYEDAAAAGIRPFPSDFTARMNTANGPVAAARVRLREVRVGDIYARDVEAAVSPQGRLDVSLLGMSFLRQLRSFDVAGNRLTLRG